MRKAFPNLRLQLTEGQTLNITRMLKEGDLDAILLALPLNDEHIREMPLYDEPFLFAASKQHDKAKQKTIALSELEDEQVLLLEDGHCLRDQALDVCGTHRAVENTNFSATSLETLRQMVGAGVGITLMPKLAVQGRAGNVVYIPFANSSRSAKSAQGKIQNKSGHGSSTLEPHRVIGLCWRNTSTRKVLIEELGQVFQRAVLPALDD